MNRRIKLLLFLILSHKRKVREKRFSLLRKQSVVLLNQWINNSYFCRLFVKMSPDSFGKLSNNLLPFVEGTKISSVEVLAITLNFLSRNETIKDQCLLFGLSNSSILKARRIGIDGINRLLASDFSFSSNNWKNAIKYRCCYNEFDGMIGAIDGTHFKIRVHEKEEENYRNRKGIIKLANC